MVARYIATRPIIDFCENVSAVVGTGRFTFGGGEEEGSGRIEQRGGDKQGGLNAPGNDDGPGMRAGVQDSNLIY